ncbi:hypothetical protein Tco_1514647 [Tanacetum coccineum]
MNDDEEEIDSDRTESDIIQTPVLNQSSTEYYEEEEKKIKEEENINDEETMDDEEDDKVTKELYKDAKVNLGNKDTEMTDADQGGLEQQNVSQESWFEQVEEDAHVTLTPVLDTQKADEPLQSSSVSSDFTSKLLNLENPSPADNEIASLMETSARHAMAVPEITFGFTTTIPLPTPFFNPLPQQATPTPTPTTSEATTSFPSLTDFSYVFKFNDRVTNFEKDVSEIKQVDQYAQALSSIPAIVDHYINNKLILPQAVSDFANPVIEKNVTESLEAAVLARSSSQPKSTYEAAASLSEFELTKILLDKMEESKSHLRADCKKKLYDALVESYNTNKDLFNTYGKVFTLKRSRDDSDKDRDPSAGSDRGTKRSKSSKEAESTKNSRSKEKKEPSYTVDDSGVQQDQEFDTGNNDEQPVDKEVSKDDCQVARTKEPRTSFDELMDTSFDFSAFVLNRLNIKDLTQEILVGPAFELLKGTCKSKSYPFNLNKPLLLIRDHRGRQVIPRDFFVNNDLKYLKGGDLSRRYSNSVTKIKDATYEIKWIEDLVQNLWSVVKDVYSRKRIIAVTRLTIMKKYDYGHLKEIEVRREGQKLYKFREGDFPRLRLQDIEDMLLLLVQQKLTNLTIDERYTLNVALRIFTKRIVIQRLVEDLQLGVESYQKKLNLTKPDIFSDGTLDDVRSALNDIAKGIRMEYLPKRKWSGLDKQMARVIIQDIDKKLYKRRLMRNLKKFVVSDDNINAIRTFGSDLSVDDVKDLSAKYELHGHLAVQAPLSPVAITKAPVGMMGIYQKFLEAGLRLPLSPLLLELLSSYGVHISSNACPRMTVALREQISMLEKHVVYSHNFLDGVLAVGGMSNKWPHRDFKPCFMEGDHDVRLVGYLTSVNPSQHIMVLKQ